YEKIRLSEVEFLCGCQRSMTLINMVCLHHHCTKEDSVVRKAKQLVVLLVLSLLVLGAGTASAKVQIDFWYSLGGQLGETVQQLVANFNASQDEYEVV